MDELINQLVSKTGIDKGIAEQVANFIKDHLEDIPGWLGKGMMDKLPGGMGDMLGGLMGGDNQN